jgi:hypothetical protein
MVLFSRIAFNSGPSYSISSIYSGELTLLFLFPLFWSTDREVSLPKRLYWFTAICEKLVLLNLFLWLMNFSLNVGSSCMVCLSGGSMGLACKKSGFL